MQANHQPPTLVHPFLHPTPHGIVRIWLAATVMNLLTGLAYAYSFELAARMGPSDGSIAALDLDAEGSINAWLNSTALLAAAALCWAARRVRTLRGASGRERLCWAWAAMTFLVMSLDEGGSLHEAFKEACCRFFGTRLHGDGSLYWVIPYGLALAVTYAGLWRYLRGAVHLRWLLLTSASCFAVAVAAQLEWFWPTEDPAEIVLEELLEVQGTLFVALAVGLQLSLSLKLQPPLHHEKANRKRLTVLPAWQPTDLPAEPRVAA